MRSRLRYVLRYTIFIPKQGSLLGYKQWGPVSGDKEEWLGRTAVHLGFWIREREIFSVIEHEFNRPIRVHNTKYYSRIILGEPLKTIGVGGRLNLGGIYERDLKVVVNELHKISLHQYWYHLPLNSIHSSSNKQTKTERQYEHLNICFWYRSIHGRTTTLFCGWRTRSSIW